MIRANCLARGVSGIRPEVVDALLACLNHDILPAIPERGSAGASGDLVPLSYVAATLTGQGSVLDPSGAGSMPSAAALAKAGLEPVTLAAKEGLALVNGTSFMSAFAVLALRDAEEIALVADPCTALAVQVLGGNPGHFAEFLFRHKPHDGLVTSAALIRRALGVDGVRTPYPAMAADADGAERALPGERGVRTLAEPLQDRYSVRCAPHVTGVLRDTLAWGRRWLTIEINSANDNPLFDVDEAAARNGGNFYGGHVGQAMDSLKTAVASVGDLLDRQLELVVDEKFNNGLTANLIRPAIIAIRCAVDH